MHQRRFGRRCRGLALILTAGTLFQATSCTTLSATLSAGLLSSIGNQLVRGLINNALGLGASNTGGF